MAGRKRKSGQRKPGGRLVQSLEDRRSASLATRAVNAALAGMIDAHWGSPIGRLFLQKEISSIQFDAASKYAHLRAAADRELGLPFRAVRAINYASVKIKDTGSGHDANEGVITACEEAERAVGMNTNALRALQAVVVLEESPAGYEQKLALYLALDRLCIHWGLTRAGKSAQRDVRNAR